MLWQRLHAYWKLEVLNASAMTNLVEHKMIMQWKYRFTGVGEEEKKIKNKNPGYCY